MNVSVRHTSRQAAAYVGSGLLLGLTSYILYASELSRAVGVVIVPFGMALIGAGIYVHYTQRAVPKAVVLVFAVVALLALGYGAYLYIDGLMHPPMPA